MDRGSLYLIACAFLYSLQPIFIKAALPFLPQFQMYAFRCVGTLFVFLPLAFHYREKVRSELRQWKKFIVPVITITGAMMLFVAGIYLAENATVMALIAKSNLVFTAILTVIFFAEERRVLSSKRFIAGVLLASIGVIGVITAGKDLPLTFGIGAILILVSQVFWSAYSVSLKGLIKNNSRLEALCVIVPMAFLVSVPFAGYEIAATNPQINPIFLLIPVAAGMALGLANIFEFKSIETKGLMITYAFTLINPLLTGLIAFFIFQETISIAQAAFAAVLIAGALLILKCECIETEGD